MKLYLFLRSIVWTSVLSTIFIVAAIVSAFIGASTQAVLALSSAAVAFAVLGLRPGSE